MVLQVDALDNRAWDNPRRGCDHIFSLISSVSLSDTTKRLMQTTESRGIIPITTHAQYWSLCISIRRSKTIRAITHSLLHSNTV